MNALNLPQVLIVSRGLIFNNGKLLLVKRHRDDIYYPNKWELPGGKLDKGETLNENLIRESKEELGIDLNFIKNGIVFYEEQSKEGKYKGYIVLTIIGLLTSETSQVNLSDEHSEYIWTNFEEALKFDLTFTTQYTLDQIITNSYLMDLLIESKALSRPNK